MCNCEDRIWHGVVLGFEQIWTNAMGIRTYKIYFNKGEAYFEISGKAQFPIVQNELLFFSGDWNGPEGKRFYQIRKVYSSEEMQHLYELEREKRYLLL